jgi:hypothetical protein
MAWQAQPGILKFRSGVFHHISHHRGMRSPAKAIQFTSVDVVVPLARDFRVPAACRAHTTRAHASGHSEAETVKQKQKGPS